ncbi:NtaA/DmoA family FMN-dependent monooxygenase [Conexibacter stalactiti]|uniref:NtaA/DmoA family FMN-dependent monooxygenase n=1 Tax=Conexibacter stalactiti TaxID=1940611 RepID=A0ABU4HLU6_9ACTN|nr:NtaA/DmoA family FMN-dependent monooxygenase [Conexibacter stalactiti]MDW5594278.1 NtaA/DmoA family FMN-dependent monooxygenase [Conexibacter stalactiti]MEC5034920.1 NtaA/DmoA family FMN-dependent monooxygenase [Conexibacter stalactiti]
MPARTLHLNAFIWPGGYHESAWKVVPEPPESVFDLRWYAEIAGIAERGRLDSLFLADNIALAEHRLEYMPQTQFDPIDLLAALAGLTERIGLIATGSTTYSAPWDLARRFATLDFVSGGRAAWNIVTTGSPLTAANFGLDAHPSHADRYARAQEFVDVVQRVWDAWDDDALVGDKASGLWARRDRVRAPRFEGEHFRVGGALALPRSPQGRPVLVQAGSSPAGIALAARYAELVFSSQPTLEEAVGFRRELRAQAAAAGRSPDAVHVLPSLVYTLAPTEAEARARQQELEELASPEFRWRNLLWVIGLDPDDFDGDQPLPESLLAGPAPTSQGERVFAAAREQRVPLRELARRLAGTPTQATFAGTPEQLAAHIEEWWRAGAVDGFTLMPTTLPHGLRLFVDEVVPLLRRRGIFRSEYAGTTLRDHFGLERPAARRAETADV